MRNEPIKLRKIIMLVKTLGKRKVRLWSCSSKSNSLSLFTSTLPSSKLFSNCINSEKKEGVVCVGGGLWGARVSTSGSNGIFYPKFYYYFCNLCNFFIRESGSSHIPPSYPCSSHEDHPLDMSRTEMLPWVSQVKGNPQFLAFKRCKHMS